ncbi:MAG: amidase [Microscillaceae bacterium]|nr:amidase [Microscillaceae bacterium]
MPSFIKLFSFPPKFSRRFYVLLCVGLLGSPACQGQRTETKPPLPFRFEEFTIAQLQQGYQQGDFTVREVVQAYLARIEAIDQNGPALRSVIQVNPEALALADILDAERKKGQLRGPLHGVPVLLKDNIDTHDQLFTTAGSRALQGSRPLQDSWIAQKLRAAGALILGKTNLSEWANFRGELSTSGWSGLGGQTKNPYVLDRNPCGSSSGSGVAVSANLCLLAIGTETNGSIVCPANANGIVGLKPTVGLLSRSGIIPISFTQDTPGPMARTVQDVALSLGVMVGLDPRDPKTQASAGHYHNDYLPFLKKEGLKGKRLGLWKGPLGRHPKVDTLFWRAVAFLKSQGADIIELEQITAPGINGPSFEVMLYEFKEGLNAYLKSLGTSAPIKSLADLIAFNRADSVELRYFDQELLEMAQAKGDLNQAEYQTALQKMLKATREDGIDKVMQSHQLDAIIAPTGGPAWKTDWVNGDAFQVGSSSPAAIAGYPSLTVPMGFVEDLPVGISFFGRAWSEPLLLEIGYAYEQGTRHRRPPQFKKGE